MKSIRFIRSFSSALLAVFALTSVFGSTARAEPGKKSKQQNAPILDGTLEGVRPHRRKTAKEKEYAELARKIRESDDTFEKTWRAAKADERRKLRSERLEKLQPTLARMNQLAVEIRNERTALDGATAPKPVPVSGSVTAPDEIKGKSESELRQMGVAVRSLHQKSGPNSVEPRSEAGK